MNDNSKHKYSPKFLSIFLFMNILPRIYGIAQAECIVQDAVPACVAGIAVSTGYSAALIEQSGRTGLRKIRQGDKVDAWTVGEIAPRYVVFSRGDESVRLNLTEDDTKIATDIPAPPPGVKKGPVRHTRSLARGGS